MVVKLLCLEGRAILFSRVLKCTTSQGTIWASGSVREVVSLFAELLNVSFGRLARRVSLLTALGDVLVLARWLYIDDEALLIGCMNNPPIRDSRIGTGDKRPPILQAQIDVPPEVD